MARTRVVGQCRNCRSGRSNCCRPRRRRGRQRTPLCGPCQTPVYSSEDEAIAVAVGATLAVGVSYFVYKCPARRGNHIAPNVTRSRS